MSEVVDFHLMELANEIDALVLSEADLEWHEAEGGYEIFVGADDADWGSADAQLSEVASALLDGDAERIDRHGNRKMQFVVFVRAPKASGLAEGERVLSLACRRATMLRWTPPAEAGEVTVHDLHWARITGGWRGRSDDIAEGAELGMPMRAFVLEMSALPFPRSAEMVVIAPAGSGTGTSPAVPTITGVYAGASGTSGWTGSNGLTATLTSPVGGGVQTGSTPFNSTHQLTRTVALDLVANGRWIVVTAKWPNGDIKLAVNGDPVFIRGQSADVRYGDEYWFWVRGVDALTKIALWGLGGPRLIVTKVSQQDTAPFAATGREVLRQFEVQGTERTEATVTLSHATVALGDVLMATWQEDGSGYTPSTGGYVITGSSPGVIPDADAAMGGYMTITSAAKAVYEIPADRLPSDTYSIVARIKASPAADVSVRVAAMTRLGGVDLAPQYVQAHRSWGTSYTLQALGQVALPTTAVPRGSTAMVRLEVSTPNSATGVRLDALYLLNARTGSLSLVNCGTAAPATGGASSKCRIAPPPVSTQRPSVMVGTAADFSDARHARALDSVPDQHHELIPGRMNSLVVSGAFNVATEYAYPPRWTQNAGKVVTE